MKSILWIIVVILIGVLFKINGQKINPSTVQLKEALSSALIVNYKTINRLLD
jgi:uncharacterized membrane protein YgaE (UPF0421/DUF939 family)